MSEEEWKLLLALRETADHGAFSMACDGKDRKHAHTLEQKGYALWRGENWGSSFWSITDEGKAAIAAR
jgi:hypothetical protein